MDIFYYSLWITVILDIFVAASHSSLLLYLFTLLLNFNPVSDIDWHYDGKVLLILFITYIFFFCCHITSHDSVPLCSFYFFMVFNFLCFKYLHIFYVLNTYIHTVWLVFYLHVLCIHVLCSIYIYYVAKSMWKPDDHNHMSLLNIFFQTKKHIFFTNISLEMLGTDVRQEALVHNQYFS